jgi:hypothetical protein
MAQKKNRPAQKKDTLAQKKGKPAQKRWHKTRDGGPKPPTIRAVHYGRVAQKETQTLLFIS